MSDIKAATDVEVAAIKAKLNPRLQPGALSLIARIEADGERMRELEAVAEELTVMHDEYGKADAETLTPDAIALKGAINRVWDELERMCPEAIAVLKEAPDA